MQKLAIAALFLFATFFASTSALSAPIQWTTATGGNGHWYDSVVTGPGITWEQARIQAEAMGGYLATPTSAAENTWVFDSVASNLALWHHDPSSFWTIDMAGPWIGAFQDTSSLDYSEPGGGWTWVSGEEWTYSNWEPTALLPDNTGTYNVAHYVMFDPHNQTTTIPSLYWNDIDNCAACNEGAPNGMINSFLIEYESNPIPEPTTLTLLAIGLISLASARTTSRS